MVLKRMNQVNPVLEMLQLGVAKRTFLQTGLLNAAGMKSAEVNSEHIGESRRDTNSNQTEQTLNLPQLLQNPI